MPIYSVGITATVTKTYNISAPDKNKAVTLAHEIFSGLFDGSDDAERSIDFVEVNPHNVPLDGEWEKEVDNA